MLRLLARSRCLNARVCGPVFQPISTHRYNGTTYPRRNHYSTTSSPTVVEKILVDTIKSTGPVSVSQYIQMCLSHPEHGFYMKGDPLGPRGDFVTSPEISQVFGELIGVWFAMQATSRKTKIDRIRIIELGPGRGTLMDDVLRTISQYEKMSPFSPNTPISVHLVENSTSLKEKQRTKLAPRIENKMNVHWWDDIHDIPDAEANEFTLLVANEFFDALPIRIFQKTERGYQEIMVDCTSSTTASLTKTIISSPSKQSPLLVQGVPNLATKAQSSFCFTVSPTITPVPLLESTPRFDSLPPNSRVELSFPSYKISRRVGELLTQGAGGAGLVIDYGDNHCFTDSFRAFRGHNLVDVFDKPGHSDLTANVDFALLSEAMESVQGTKVQGFHSQASFLNLLGLGMRVEALCQKASPERKAGIIQGARKLVDTNDIIKLGGMGKKFKVMGVTGVPSGSMDEELDVFPFGQSVEVS